MSFGAKLKEIRKKHQLSQVQMSEKLDMEQSTYCRYEIDKTHPTLDVINRVVETFNVDYNWLMQNQSKTVIFETGSTNHIGVVQNENYYAVPKEMMDGFKKHFDNLDKIVNKMYGDN